MSAGASQILTRPEIPVAHADVAAAPPGGSSPASPLMQISAATIPIVPDHPAALYEMASRLGNTADAGQLFERAAQGGFAPAQLRLAGMYEQGQGVDRDLTRAISWYERAAEGGNLNAMHRLATLLQPALGVILIMQAPSDGTRRRRKAASR